ncbi:ethanolamine kinase 2 isoform X1 [Alligator sinensis]|uniref:ethanolamine kinase n=2 Tax=Alligator TaxID=8495 RepID=A0A3Q0GPG2_ALLSI|nr:ethanolamine kinase 2 isoform X1 [Alligator sinensis]
MACYVDEAMADAVLVRVYGRKTELFVDRESELRNFQVLQAHGCAPSLYCSFQNGLCYEFMQGIALGPEHVQDPQMFRLIAQEMAKMHAIHANGSLPKPSLWHKLHKFLSIVKTELFTKVSNPSLHQDVPSLEVLEQEVAWVQEYLSQLGSPVVLCHNDLLCKNIIYNEAEGHVRFIDYEYTSYNYQAFDIGNHFNEFAGGGLPAIPQQRDPAAVAEALPACLQATEPRGPGRWRGSRVRQGAGDPLCASEQVLLSLPFALGILGPDSGQILNHRL